MADQPIAKSAGPDGQSPHPDAGPQPPIAVGGRPAGTGQPGRKKMLTPLVLALAGVAMLAAAWRIYPAAAGNPTPGYSEVAVYSAVPVNYVSYIVNRDSTGKADVSVSVVLPAGVQVPAHPATVQVWLPIGDTFAHCHPPDCHVERVGHEETSYWSRPLTFAPASRGLAATWDFTVNAADFGATFDGVNASAAIPDVRYYGPYYHGVAPIMLAGYPIKSASQYDWTSFEPEDATSHSAVWREDILYGETASRVAVGINHGGQAHNDLWALVAGTLLALGGGALLSALQTFLDARR